MVLSLFFSFSVLADLTTFVWLQDQNNPFKGLCYEVDEATMGNEYALKVLYSKCRPKDGIYKWVPKDSGVGGNCYYVDKEKQEAGFSSYASMSECKPKETHTLMAPDGTCLRVDSETGGGAFAIKVNKKECAPKELANIFVPYDRIIGGTCYSVDMATGGKAYKQIVDVEKCKPAQTKYVYYPDNSNPTKGNCYEVPMNGNIKEFVLSKNIRHCVSGEPEYFFADGKCFAKNSSVDGQVILQGALMDKCKVEQTEYFYVRKTPTNGTCFEVDSLTKGNQFKKRAEMKNCRPKSVEYKIITYLNSPRCVRVDAETGGGAFAEEAPSRYCDENIGKFKWVPREKNEWEGHCVQMVKRFGQAKKNILLAETCKPKKTIYTWNKKERLVGRCYEVHGELGPSAYSVGVNSTNCRPDKIEVYYHHDPKGKLGGCYEVDSKTKGEEFAIKVTSTKCKDILRVNETLKNSW